MRASAERANFGGGSSILLVTECVTPTKCSDLEIFLRGFFFMFVLFADVVEDEVEEDELLEVVLDDDEEVGCSVCNVYSGI